MTQNTECILLYVKYPEPGQVKTRLAKSIGQVEAAELYTCFIRDLAEMLSALPQQVCVCYAPQDSGAYFRNRLGPECSYEPQHGSHLGERMKHSFRQAFQQGFERVLIIGSDIPDLPRHIISEGFEELSRSDAVIGPALDGGYYLLGFTKEGFTPDVFDDMSWSTSIVFEQTRKKLDEEQRRYAILAEWSDIDTLVELERFLLRCRKHDSAATHSQSYCRTLRNFRLKGDELP